MCRCSTKKRESYAASVFRGALTVFLISPDDLKTGATLPPHYE